MALLNKQNDNYIKIIIEEEPMHDLNIQQVLVEIFENTTHRENGNTSFQKSYHKHIQISIDTNIVEILMKSDWTEDESWINNYKIALYLYIKTLSEYEDYIDY